MENNDNNNRRVYIRTYLYKCFYFCPTFHKIYRELSGGYLIFARFQGPEAMLVCENCLKNIRRHVTEDKSSSFDEAMKMLIQYYIPISGSHREMSYIPIKGSDRENED